MKKCCVTGHREIKPRRMNYVRAELRAAIKEAIEDGFSYFICGFAPGADMIFAELIVELQTKNPQIQLEAALPYETWFGRRNLDDKAILERCCQVKAHSPSYTKSCFLIRNHYMVNHCERVIAVYDGREKGGTVNTMRYATLLERDIRVIKV